MWTVWASLMRKRANGNAKIRGLCMTKIPTCCVARQVRKTSSADLILLLTLLPVSDHLTQFSLLLTGGEGSSSEEYVVAWLSLGFAGGAILFFLAGALVVEMIRFKEAIRRRTVLAELRSLQLSANVL